MTRNIRMTLGLALLALVSCQSTTEPEAKTVGAEVGFVTLRDSVCLAPGGPVNMSAVEFENTSDTTSIVPKQLSVRLDSATNTTVKMWMFNPEWRNTDGSITANVDAQTDPFGSYIQFGVLPSIPPGGKFRTMLKGNIPSASVGTYYFSITPDSVKVKTVIGESVGVTVMVAPFILKIKTCP